MPDKQETAFARSEDAKEAALLEMRARFAAATPPTRPRKRQHDPLDWRRAGKAALLIAILLAAMLVAGFAHAAPWTASAQGMGRTATIHPVAV